MTLVTTLASTDNGTTWATEVTPWDTSSETGQAVAADGSGDAVGGSAASSTGSSTPQLQRSTTGFGTSWSSTSSSALITHTIAAIATDNAGTYLAALVSSPSNVAGNDLLLRSTDHGATWASVMTVGATGAGATVPNQINDIAWLNSQFIVVGSNGSTTTPNDIIGWSADGSSGSWTFHNNLLGGTSIHGGGQLQCIGFNGTTYCVSGSMIAPGPTSFSFATATSLSGTWTGLTVTGSSGQAAVDLLYDNGHWVILVNGVANPIITTPDLVTFTSRTSPLDAGFFSAVANLDYPGVSANGRWIVVGGACPSTGVLVITSDDFGATWTWRTTPIDSPSALLLDVSAHPKGEFTALTVAVGFSVTAVLTKQFGVRITQRNDGINRSSPAIKTPGNAGPHPSVRFRQRFM